MRFGYDLGSTGNNPLTTTGPHFSLDDDGHGSPLYASLDTLWATGALDGKIEAQILVVGSYAYVVTRGGTFYKLDADTGAIVDTYAIGSPSSCTPHIVSGVAYFGCDGGVFHAVDVSTMTAVWTQSDSGDPCICHAVVVAGSSRVWYGTTGGKLIARATSNGALVHSDSFSIGVTTPQGPLAYYSTGGLILIPTSSGVQGYEESTGDLAQIFASRALAHGAAWQAADWGQDVLCFVAEDHFGYAYDLATGDRIWHDFQTGDLQSPVGMDIATGGSGLVAIGTRNYSIQPHQGDGGRMQWKHDSFVQSSAIVAGFAICNGILGYVYPSTNGRLELIKLDGPPGGHGPDWKFGTSTGVQGGTSSANKGRICCPTFIRGRVYWGADDKIARCFE